MKKALFWVGALISIALLVVSLRGLNLDEFLADLRQASLGWLIPGIVAYFLAVGMRAWRWKQLLRPVKVVALSKLYPMVVIGYMGNNIYPARIGELIRAYVLKRREGVAIATTLSTVFIERLMDAIVMATFVLVGLPRVQNLPDWVHSSLFVGSLVFAAATVMFFTFALAPRFTHSIADTITSQIIPARFRVPAMGFVERFIEGAAALRDPCDPPSCVPEGPPFPHHGTGHECATRLPTTSSVAQQCPCPGRPLH